MANCKDCIKQDVCNRDAGHGYSVCPNYLSADVAEVKHGEWILHDYAEVIECCAIPNYECSVCGIWKREDSDYCPNCGAKMDGGQTE